LIFLSKINNINKNGPAKEKEKKEKKDKEEKEEKSKTKKEKPEKKITSENPKVASKVGRIDTPFDNLKKYLNQLEELIGQPEPDQKGIFSISKYLINLFDNDLGKAKKILDLIKKITIEFESMAGDIKIN